MGPREPGGRVGQALDDLEPIVLLAGCDGDRTISAVPVVPAGTVSMPMRAANASAVRPVTGSTLVMSSGAPTSVDR